MRGTRVDSRRLSWLSLGLALLHLGCQPFYRDDELRALRAADSPRGDRLVAAGQRELDAGRPGPAERLLAQAIELNPQRDGESYLLLARAQLAAGHRAAARATARFALDRTGPASSHQGELRRFLIRAYAEDGLIARALDWLDDKTLTGALRFPELAAPLSALAEAEQLAQTQPVQALSRYAEWLSLYGEPDHPLLRAARERILGSAEALTRPFLEEGARLLRSGDAGGAVRRYALAYRYQSEQRLSAALAEFASACAALPSPESLSPLSSSEARRGDVALKNDHLGEALLSYRRAVVAAPCWAVAHRNLALLLAQIEQRDEAARQMNWFLRLTSRPGAQERALLESWVAPTAGQAAAARETASDNARRVRAAAWQKKAGIVLLTLGLVSGGMAGLFGYLGADVNNQIRGGNLATIDELQRLHAAGQRDNSAAIGLAVTGGVLAAASIPLLVIGLRNPVLRLAGAPGMSAAWSGSEP